MAEQIFSALQPLEQLRIFTPLGIRFWDPAMDVPVVDDLTVTARLPGLQYPVVRAVRTASGVYAFHGLPGLRDAEYGPAAGSPPSGSPPTPRRFLIEVADRQRRFLPVAFNADVPYGGIFPTQTVSSPPGSPPGGRPPGFFLFSAPTRPATPALAAVRVQLVERIDAVRRRPAAFAVLEVQIVGGATWYGVADERGSIAVLFPYPIFSLAPVLASPPGSPPGASTTGALQTWIVQIRVRYAPAVLTFPSGSSLPDLRSIFSQAPGSIFPTLAVPLPPAVQLPQPVSQLSAELTFNQELVMRTDTGSTLLIGAAGSPP